MKEAGINRSCWLWDFQVTAGSSTLNINRRKNNQEEGSVKIIWFNILCFVGITLLVSLLARGFSWGLLSWYQTWTMYMKRNLCTLIAIIFKIWIFSFLSYEDRDKTSVFLFLGYLVCAYGEFLCISDSFLNMASRLLRCRISSSYINKPSKFQAMPMGKTDPGFQPLLSL